MNRKLLLVPAIVAALGLGSGIAYASIPAADGTIDSCYVTNDHPHPLYIIDSTASCPTGDTKLVFNQTGPQGPAGPTATLSETSGGTNSVTVAPGTSATVTVGGCGSGTIIGGTYTLVTPNGGPLTPGYASYLTDTFLVYGESIVGGDYSITVYLGGAPYSVAVVLTATCINS
jgi:hypothetical protein